MTLSLCSGSNVTIAKNGGPLTPACIFRTCNSMADAVEAIRLSWTLLAEHLSFRDMLASLHTSSRLRRALQQTPPATWTRAAHCVCSLPSIPVTSMPQFCIQVQRVLHARTELLSPNLESERWQQAGNGGISAVAMAPCSNLIALVHSRSVRLIRSKDGSTAASVALRSGWQGCTISFSPDSTFLAILCHCKRRRLEVKILDVETKHIVSRTDALDGQLVIQSARCWPLLTGLAIQYSVEDGGYAQQNSCQLVDWQSCVVLRRVCLPKAWLLQPEPRVLQAQFSPALSFIAAIPAAAPTSVAIHAAQSLVQLFTLELQCAGSTLLWLGPDEVLVRGREGWLVIVQVQEERAGIKWTAQVPRHHTIWPCPGAQSLVLESRQALGDLAASRQLWLVDKATGRKRSFAGKLDLHAVRLQHCSLHPQGLAVSLIYSPTGRSGKCSALLLPLQGSADLVGKAVTLAEWQPKAQAAHVEGVWSSDGTRLLMCHGQSAILHDFG